VAERIKAWQCIGCGRLDAPQPCVGVCQDRKVELVNAEVLDRALLQLQEFESIVRVLAHATPRDGEWERSYRLLQDRARLLLAK
jgi:hypothetical protein